VRLSAKRRMARKTLLCIINGNLAHMGNMHNYLAGFLGADASTSRRGRAYPHCYREAQRFPHLIVMADDGLLAPLPPSES
jgi:hypothetical protein